jgi:hypothetical protein
LTSRCAPDMVHHERCRHGSSFGEAHDRVERTFIRDHGFQVVVQRETTFDIAFLCEAEELIVRPSMLFDP